MNPGLKVQDQIRAVLSLLWECEPHNLPNRPAARSALVYLRDILRLDLVRWVSFKPGLEIELRLLTEETQGFVGASPHEPHVETALCVQRCLEALLSPYTADSEGLAHSALGLAMDLNKRAPRT